MKKKLLRTVSLFAGCGGMDLGFHGGFEFLGRRFAKNPFEIVYAVDKDPEVVDLYNQNTHLISSRCDLRDIREIKSEAIPEFDFLTAGFPCQPFSNAGNRKGVHDDDGRGVLFEECERIIKDCQKKSKGKLPLGFVFENVKGILSTKMPSGRTVPEELVARMKRLGFETSYRLVKASDYGVPQNRERVLMVGFRSGTPGFDFDELDRVAQDMHLPSAKGDPYELTVGWLLSSLGPSIKNQGDYWKYSPGSQSMVDMIGPCEVGAEGLKLFKKRLEFGKMSPVVKKGRSWKNVPVNKLPLRFKKIYDNPKKYRAPNFYRRFALGEICGTITASAQPENAGITHPFENRRYSIREIARIQSFPDNFDFSHRKITAPYKGIGNAVAPVMAWVLAKAISRHLEI